MDDLTSTDYLTATVKQTPLCRLCDQPMVPRDAADSMATILRRNQSLAPVGYEWACLNCCMKVRIP